ncbi:MAG: hypothetical protein NTU54_02150 [Candidatus Omnitrophica bacterium]|nr:hypothetical protein [Candidatus Omnitrophota bacterium]
MDNYKGSQNQKRLEIALAADRNMEIGLHVTLYSALASLALSGSFVNLHLFLKDYDLERVKRLHMTLHEFTGKYALHLYDTTAINLGKSRGIYGNKMTLVRIHIPDSLKVERFIYLDADLLVLTDLRALFSFPLNNNVAAVVSNTIIKNVWHLERDALLKCGMPDNARYFNAGVMLIDARRWRENNYTEKCVALMDKHPSQFPSADQAILNIILYNRVAFLPEKFNVPFFTREPVLDLRFHHDILCHFLDSPKPWDIGAELIHASYPAFKQFLQKTYFSGYRTYAYFDIEKVKRTLAILITYLRFWRNAHKTKKSLYA